jgi:acetyl-CoA C-acetyltransferase
MSGLEIGGLVTIKGKAFIAGAFEHPQRDIPDKSLAQVHAEVALGALADAGLALSDVDGLLGANVTGRPANIPMADYLGLKRLTYLDSTETGGSSPIAQLGHAAALIAAGKCNVCLVVRGGLQRQQGRTRGGGQEPGPETAFEQTFGPTTISMYALAARRHMYEFGTTSAQLAAVKVTASHHAQYNPNALLKKPVTVEEVLASPMISDPLHRLDCCVVSDGGGAFVVVSPAIARDLDRTCVKVLGQSEAPKHATNGKINLTHTGAVWTGPRAFEEAGVTHGDIDYASIYDSFTITVVETIEDLGFCKKGEGGAFAADGALESPNGALPFNTDGGGLCNNHPNGGGMTKVIEAVRQLRGEANAEVQVPDCEIALAHGTGGSLGTRMGSVTAILGREDA